MKCTLVLLVLLLAACPMNKNVGQATTASTGASSGGVSATGGVVGGRTSGGQSAASTGTNAGTGTAGSSGTSTGSTTTGGGGTSSGSSGGTSGDAGGCGVFGTVCRGNSDCCSGACNGTCSQPFGQKCDSNDDCSSDSCVNEMCACSSDGGLYDSATSFGFSGPPCAVDQDCCLPGQVCQQVPLFAKEYGQCCSPVGGACAFGGSDGGGRGYVMCCAGLGACVDDECQCQPPQAICEADADCCEGKCKSNNQFYLDSAACASGAGQACSSALDCESRNCVDGGCGQCSEPNGSCASDNDCCNGLVCAEFQPIYRPVLVPEFISFGLNCCTPNGLSCSTGLDCCSEVCGSDGSCTCMSTSERCYSDRGCCGGGACMPEPLDGGALACCQVDGEGCFADGDCCSGTCQNQKCGCVAAGGACGLPGQVAPEGAQACCSGQCSSAGACL